MLLFMVCSKSSCCKLIVTNSKPFLLALAVLVPGMEKAAADICFV